LISDSQADRATETVGNRAVAHAKWVLLAGLAGKLVSLAATMVLARLLVPAEFGLVSLAAVVLGIVAIFQDAGVGRSLLAQPGPIEHLIRPGILASAATGALCYLGVLLAAFPLAAFYHEPRLLPILAILGLSVPLQAMTQVPSAVAARRGAFRLLFVLSVAQVLTYAALSVLLAWLHFGPWALVAGQLGSTVVRSAGLMAWGGVPWRRVRAEGARLDMKLLRSGGVLTAESLLNWGADGLVLLTLGRVAGVGATGLYNVAFEAARMPMFAVSALSSTLAPTGFAALADRPQELKRVVLKSLRVLAYTYFPVAIGMALLAPWLVPSVWGDRWLGAVPVLAALSLMGLPTPLSHIFAPILLTFRRLRAILAFAAFRFVAYVVMCLLVVPHGAAYTALAHVAQMFVWTALQGALALALVGVRPRELASTLMVPTLAAGVMAAAVVITTRLLTGVPPVAMLIASTPVGAAVYLALCWRLDRATFREVASIALRGVGRSSDVA
jgi:PST family polysaccharide transporter